METVLNTPYFSYNPCAGLLYAEKANPSLAAQHALEIYNFRSRGPEASPQNHNPEPNQSTKRQRKTQNRSRTLYNKRLLVNARERERMKILNKGFENLRNALPCYIADGHISKITTLRLAINYIKTLSAVLQDAGAEEETTFKGQQVFDKEIPENLRFHTADVNQLNSTTETIAVSHLQHNSNEIENSFNPEFAPIITAERQ